MRRFQRGCDTRFHDLFETRKYALSAGAVETIAGNGFYLDDLRVCVCLCL